MAPPSPMLARIMTLGAALYYPLIAHAVVAPRCNADNCARAITGSRRGEAFIASASSDCSDYLATTLVVDTVTITVGEQPQTTVPPAPKSVPAYASPCAKEGQYESACSCFGVTGTTVTVTSTIVVVASPTPETCVPGNCDVGFPTCGSSNVCGCSLTTEGDAVCTNGRRPCPSLPDCDTTVDCSEGFVCVVGTCCGRNVCSSVTDVCSVVSAETLFTHEERLDVATPFSRGISDSPGNES
nr:uncharacterized protein CTRU02_12693 [Colletotrichum truncatum]KAF6784431.1 hypothetical protein CTRU02_12693 [Colletotrichum truncatum]